MTLKYVGGHDEPDRDGRLPAVSAPVNGAEVCVQPALDAELAAAAKAKGKPVEQAHWDDLELDLQTAALQEMSDWSQAPTAPEA